MYQSRLAAVREDAESMNHGWRSEVWFITKSRMMRTPRRLPSLTSRSKSWSVPYWGSMLS